MSWLSKQLKSAGKVAKKGVKAIGKGWEAIDDIALPLIGNALVPGLGGVVGGALAAGIGNGRPTLKRIGAGALSGAVTGYGGSLLGKLGGSAVKGVAGAAGGGVPNIAQLGVRSMTPGVAGGVSSGIANAASAGASRGIGSALAGGLKQIGGFALKNPDLLLGGAAMLQGNKAQKQASKYQQQALDLAMARDAELSPLRTMGRDRMMNAQRPDLNSDFASANPFARPLRRIG